VLDSVSISSFIYFQIRKYFPYKNIRLLECWKNEMRYVRGFKKSKRISHCGLWKNRWFSNNPARHFNTKAGGGGGASNAFLVRFFCRKFPSLSIALWKPPMHKQGISISFEDISADRKWSEAWATQLLKCIGNLSGIVMLAIVRKIAS
jgi:hypothetical protein